MKFSASFLDILRQRLPLSQNVASYTPLKRKGNDFLGICPFHKEKTPSFTVNDAKGFYHCFGCGVHGDIISFVQHMRHLSFPEAVQYLAGLAGLALPDTESSPESSYTLQVQEALIQASVWFEKNLYRPEGHQARLYLTNRKLHEDTWRAFNIGWAPGNNGLSVHLLKQGFTKDILEQAGLIGPGVPIYDRFRQRLIFPIKNKNQKIIGFGGRLIQDGNPKYLNSPETILFKKGENLYNLKYFQEKTPVVVVEGYIDVITLVQAGFKTAVAPLGTALTEKQIQLLWRHSPEPLICFDGDQAGKMAAKRTIERVLPLLKSGYSLNFVFLPSQLDPDNFVHQYGIEAWNTLLNTSVALHKVVWDAHQQTYKTDTPERLSFSRKMLKQLLSNISDAEIRHHYNRTMEKNWQMALENTKTFSFKKGSQKSPLVPVSPLNSNIIQQRILLAVPLNHPEILPEIFESLADLNFAVPSYEFVQKTIIDLYSDLGSIDKQDIILYLNQMGYENVVKELMGTELLVHAAFSGPQSSPQQALQGWQETLKWYKDQCLLNEQTAAAAAQVNENLNTQTWERLKNLKHSALQTLIKD